MRVFFNSQFAEQTFRAPNKTVRMRSMVKVHESGVCSSKYSDPRN